MTTEPRTAFRLRWFRVTVAALACGASCLACLPAHAAEPVRRPACPELAAWAAKYDDKDEWRPSPIGDRHRFARLFVQEETTTLFGKPVASWDESDAKAARESVLTCRRETRDRELSGRYNRIQSALAGRVADFARESGPARDKARRAMATLASVSPSPKLLRLQLALADAGTPEGYRKLQRAAGSLPPRASQAAGPARELASTMVNLAADDLAAIVTTPAAQAAAGMRTAVLDSMIADLARMPADRNGLHAIQQARQAVARDYADVFSTTERERLDKAIAARHAAIGDQVATMVVAAIGQSSSGFDDAFADIEARSAPQLASLLSPAQAARIRDAAQARRASVAESLYTGFTTDLAKLPEDEASLDRIDEAGAALGRWPAHASDQAQRFRKAAEARRVAILAAVDRKEAGRMAGRVYQSSNGQDRFEFVDRKRVLVSSAGHTTPAEYVEEKDGRVSVTAPSMAVTLEREGRRLRGWSVPLARVK